MKLKKRKALKIISAVCFIAFWVLMIYLVQRLLMPKYQSGVVEGSMIEQYYDDGTKHDVIMVGDCEVYENISTVELWRRYGITSYIRGSAQQLAWQSYYLLEDTLRYETPKVVVFNVLSLKYNEPQSEAYNRMTLDGMQWSGAKVDAINASMTKDEKFEDYVFPLFRYHSRWSELEDDDFEHWFSKDPVTHNGYYMRADVRAEGEFPDPTPLTDYTLGSNAMDYLDRIRKLCEEKGIKLVLMKAPTLYPHWYEQWDEQIKKYSSDNGLSYLNFISCRDEIGLDMSHDTYDAGLHLNIYGAEKLADYFGRWLADECGLSDHRSDGELAAHYGKLEEAYDNEKNSQLREIEQNGELISHKPAAKKETNVLKNFIIIAALAVLCLVQVGCGSESKKETESAGGASSSASPESSQGQTAEGDGFALDFNGTQVVLGAEMKPVADKLGKPTKYFESQSCAYQGLDKVYTYGGVIIRTYPENDVDYVLSIELKDDSVSTAEGISIGDAKDKVRKAYGEPSSSADTSDVFTKGGSKLSVIYGSDGNVSSIVYDLNK